MNRPLLVGDVLARPHLPALDGIRAIAVGVVMAFHFAPATGIPGDLGVTLFFVLSGFLITSLLRREWRERESVSLRDFYLRRVLRIFPAYYAFLGGVAILMLASGRSWPPGQGWAALVFMTDYYDALVHDSSSSIAHLWSIGTEEKFYLLWPLAFMILARKGRAFALYSLGFTVAAIAIWRSAGLLFLDGTVEYAYHAFETRADSLVIGCLLSFALESKVGSRAAASVSAYWWMPLLTIVAIAVVRLPVSSANLFHYSAGFTVEAALAAVLIVQLMLLSASWPWRWLELPGTRYLGRISYPLYLWHPIAWFVGSALPIPPVLQVFAMVLGSIGLASASYYLVEKPFLRMKRRFERVRTS